MLVKSILLAVATLSVTCVDVDISDDEEKPEMEKEEQELTHIKVIHLDEDSILRNEVAKTEYDRMVTMLIAIPATLLPVCCCIWLCRRFCDPKSRLRDAAVKYAPGIEQDSRGDVRYREITDEERDIIQSAPERIADVGGKGGGRGRMKGKMKGLKKALRKRSPKKLMNKMKKGVGKRFR